MHTDVQQLVSHCMVCDRVRASFNAPTPQLHPLGLSYRYSLDFVGPLPLMVRHNRYVLVMVEHLSKWIDDAFPNPEVNPLEGSPKCSYGKRDSEGRSRPPTLERGRGSSWEPRD
jgi:hypothetical protein